MISSYPAQVLSRTDCRPTELAQSSLRRKRIVCAGMIGAVLALAVVTAGCGSDDAIAPPAGRAEVLPSGQIVLTGCPSSDPIDTRESYELSTPTGSCQAGATSCQVRTQQWCPGGLQGPILNWSCSCAQGAWVCEVGNRGTQYCPTLPNRPPVGDSQRCAYDPARRQGIECTGDVSQCDVTTIQQCPGGGQGRTSRWSCACQNFPLLSPGTEVWACDREPAETGSCAANSCPIVASYSVNTTRASVGERIELRATARDDDGDDLTMQWSASVGRLVNPYTGNTSYTCSQAGTVKLSFTVSDGTCEGAVAVDVECI